ncbi:Flp family type IVb pilin [Novosphingobium sp. APW14]|uniref:Flp family type IVb pilin n=1 Tax=Novosphingobium sp. APW14 TaxID=3077237 RepID=UPI0028E044CD|nr:Flp family type IVb pilin [Novosphingobium sp. APW14]MDT9012769.1 Flp family type IVb pilin [Novosphingobium sp. APW14]
MSFLKKLLRDRQGTAAVELGLILGLIVIGIFAAVNSLGNETTNSFNSTARKVFEATK